MSGHYNFPMDTPALDQYEPNLSIYDQQYGAFQRLSGAPTPHEGFAFWYRPDSRDATYHQEPQVFNRAMPLQPTTLTMTEATSTKHRRTRSGCFTCRSRRVKCDETRPVCDRCRKGNRECEFPQNTSSAKRTKSSDPKSATSETAPESKLEAIKDESDEEDEEDYDEPEDQPTPPPPEKSTKRSSAASRARTKSITASRPRQQSNPSERTTEQFSTPSSDSSELVAPQSPMSNRESPSARWKTLKPDLKPEMEQYLRFQHDHMTFYHYLFKVDPEDFVHEELINLALRFEPLLYAVVAFAAYHYTIRLPDSEANFNAFWKYYCKSIVKLRKYLESTEERSDVVLVTVLQLATFEEYLGDWTNLASHHRAAHGILTSKYTPATIMNTDRGRKMFDWFIRLDIISGLMAVRDSTLDRSWIDYALHWHEERCKSDKAKPQYKLEYFSKSTEVIGHDIAHTFAEANQHVERGQISIDRVLEKAEKLNARLDKLRRQIQQLNNHALSSVDYTTHDEEDAFDAQVPLFRGELWPLNFVWMDWYGILILLKNQILLAMQKAKHLQQLSDPDYVAEEQQHPPTIPPELTAYSTAQCQIYNAIDRSPSAPAGATLISYAALGLSSVFLPRAPPASNSRYTNWARRQIANIELQGYIWPPHFRRQMAQLWQDPEIEDWWLPNGEGKKKILGEVRMIVEDRIAAATTSGRDDGRNDLREIKGLFEKMDVGQTRRRSSATLDPAYINSSAGMAHAASMVSTPEDGSSGGSVHGFSPQASTMDVEKGSRSRKTSRAGVAESPIMHSGTGNRMSGIWEEQP